MTCKKYTIIATVALIAIGLPTAVFADFVDDTCSDYRGLKRVTCNEVQGLWAQVNQNTSNINDIDDRLFLLEYLQGNDVSASAVIVEISGQHRVLVTVSGFSPGDAIEWNEVSTSCLAGDGVMPLDGSNLNITSLRTVELCGIPIGSTITLSVNDTSITNPNTSQPLSLSTEVTYNP